MYFFGAIFFVGFISTIANGPVPLCTNNFVKTMNCNLNSVNALNCTRYTLVFKPEDGTDDDTYSCVFTDNARGLCACTVQMPQFLSFETYDVNLWDGEKLINSHKLTPAEHIKPNPPNIYSVKVMENGNYLVTWKSKYASNSFLFGSLRYQFNYKKKGEADKKARIFNVSQSLIEIPMSELEQDTVYVAKVRSYSLEYTSQFSDWSPDESWTNHSSALPVESLLRIVMPVLCVLLIITLCFLYWCILRIKKKWWNTIPNPFIKPLGPGNNKVFIPIQKSEPVNLKIDLIDNMDKSRKSLLRGVGTLEDMYPKTGLLSGESSKSEYARTYNVSEEKTVSSRLMHSLFEEAFRNLVFNPNAQSPVVTHPATQSLYKNIAVTPAKDSGIGLLGCMHPQSQGSSEGSGSYKNISYSWISTLQGSGNQELVMREKSSDSSHTPLDSSAIDDYHSYDSEVLKIPGQLLPAGHDFPGALCCSTTPRVSPLILTDLEYQSCNGSAATTTEMEDTRSTCSSQADDDLEISAPFVTIHGMDNGYQSFSDAARKASAGGASLPSKWLSKTSVNVHNLTDDTLVCSINPAYAGLPSLAPSKDNHHGYQGFLHSNSEPFPGMDGLQQEQRESGQKLVSSRHPEIHLPILVSLTPQSTQNMIPECPARLFSNTPFLTEIFNDNSYHKV